MSNTYSQIYLKFVFALKTGKALFPKAIRRIAKILTGLIENRKIKMLAINCMPDHTHIFVGFKPVISTSDFVKEIKVGSNEFTNNQNGRDTDLHDRKVTAYSLIPIHISARL
jgi:putative transposase